MKLFLIAFEGYLFCLERTKHIKMSDKRYLSHFLATFPCPNNTDNLKYFLANMSHFRF